MNEVELPQGWVKAKVGDYLYLKNGFAFKSNAYVDKTESTYPVIRISDIDGMCASDKDAVHVSTPMAGFEVSEGDLLIAMSGATTGKVGVYKGISPAFQNQRVGNLKLHSDKLGCRAYRNYLITALSSDILKIAYGGAQPNISGKAIEDMDIQLPPLAEQKVIADKLDTLLAQVESIKARLERIPEILKQFRQSVLAAAVSGKLTEVWRANKQSKFEIDSLTNEKLSLIKAKLVKKDLHVEVGEDIFDLPEGWETLALQSFATKITDGEHSTPKRESSGHYLLSARNVRDGFLDLSNVDYVGNEEFLKLRKRCDPDEGDILISCSGSVGRISLVDRSNKYVMVRSAALVKIMHQFLNNKYLMYVLQSPLSQKQIEEKSKSTAQANLFLSQIKELSIPCPSIEEQMEIVRLIDHRFTVANSIEKQVHSALDRVSNLTQSILAKSFRGELTAEWREANPELISGENCAEALLERIKAERELSKPATKRGRGKA